MSKAHLLQLASSAICMAGLALGSAQADTINFNLDTPGAKANGFASESSLDTSFSTVGVFPAVPLVVLDATSFGVTGNALTAYGDDPAARLQVNFGTAVVGITVTFGNDQPGYLADRAWLVLFMGATQVASVFTTTDLDPTINQTVSYSGGASFDTAQVYFGETSGAGAPLSMLVSSISFDRTAVSEPGSLALLGAGLLGLGLVQQRRRSASTDA